MDNIALPHHIASDKFGYLGFDVQPQSSYGDTALYIEKLLSINSEHDFGF